MSARATKPEEPVAVQGRALCSACNTGPEGKIGHAELRFDIVGPYPGQHTFKCAECDARWVRRVVSASRFGWSRLAAQMPVWRARQQG